MFVSTVPPFSVSQERSELMQKQLEGLSFLDKRKATKPKLLIDQVPSVSAVPPDADQIIVPVQKQTSGNTSSPYCIQVKRNLKVCQLTKLQNPAVVSPSKPPPAKSTKRVAPVPRRLYTILLALL
jgi:hypothetical protein